MKLLLCLLMSASAHGMFNLILPSELSSYKNYIEVLTKDVTRDIEMLKKQHADSGLTDAFCLRMGIFCKTYTTRFSQIRQMDIYTQNLMSKSLNQVIPWVEQIMGEVYKKEKACKK